MADNTPGDTLQVPRSGSIIQKRHRPAIGTLAGDLALQPIAEVSMPYPQFCAIPRAPAIPSPLLVNEPPFWVAAAVACRFAGLPATYTVERFEDLAELVADPVGFAADLAGLSRAEYQRLLAGGAS